MAFTPAPNMTGGAFGSGVIKAAFDRYFELALRHAPILRDIADKRPVQVDKPGSQITLSIHNDLPVVTGTLTEGDDVTPATLPAPNTVTITLEERGNAVITHRLLREFAMTDVDPYVANAVAYNMRDSLDTQFQEILRQGTNVLRPEGVSATSGVDQDSETTHKITSRMIRTVVTRLRSNAAVPKRDDLYACYIHPDVSFDLKEETGAAAWRDPHNYVAPDNIWRHVVGVYEGAYFVESARMFKDDDGAVIGGGPGTTTVYRTIFCGQQAMAEAVAVEPQLVMDGKVGADLLSRLYTIGWYSVLGWARYREQALYRVETVSTLN